MSEINKTIGNSLKKARKLRGMTRIELGMKMHYSDSTIAYYESGAGRMSVDKLFEFADALDVPVIWLLNCGEVVNDEKG